MLLIAYCIRLFNKHFSDNFRSRLAVYRRHTNTTGLQHPSASGFLIQNKVLTRLTLTASIHHPMFPLHVLRPQHTPNPPRQIFPFLPSSPSHPSSPPQPHPSQKQKAAPSSPPLPVTGPIISIEPYTIYSIAMLCLIGVLKVC
jgi:hypothetical protein